MTSDFKKAIAAEAFKLKRQRAPYFLTAMVVLVAVLMFFFFDFTARRNWMGVPSGHFVAASTLLWMTTVMTLLGIVLTSFLVAQEFALGTVKAAWVRPVTRRKWYTAKIVTAAMSTTGFFLLAAIVVLLFALVRVGFSDLLEKTYVVHTAGSLTGRMFLAIGLTIWGLWAVCAVAGVVAGWICHPGGAIATSIGIGIILMVAGAFPVMRPFVVTTCVSAPFEQMVAMSKGLPLPYEWKNLVITVLVFGGVWMSAAFVLGQQLMQRKDVTQ